MNLKHTLSAHNETPPLPIVPDSIDDGQITSPAQIDARRAHGLLDRAQHLAERGDLPAALLACRQAIALDHDAAEGYSMLGGLLERTHDYLGALHAYEKAVELSPSSALDVESLKRLREKMAITAKAAQVHFTESELLANDDLPSRVETPIAPVPATAPAVLTAEAVETEASHFSDVSDLHIEARLPPSRAAEIPAPVTEPIANTPAVTTDAIAAPVVTAAPVPARANPTPPVPDPYVAPSPKASIFGAPANSYAGEQRSGERRQLQMPIDADRRSGADRRMAGVLAAPFVFDPLDRPQGVPAWSQLVRGPSFFGRTLPLVALTVVSLGFLGWARGRAVSQLPVQQPGVVETDASQLAQPPVETITTQSNNTLPATPNQVPAPTTAPGNGFPISNTPQITTPVVSDPATNPVTNTAGGTRVAAVSRPRGGRASSRPVPTFPNSLPPAAIAPGAIRRPSRSNASGGGSSLADLPSPEVGQNQAPAPTPVQVLPSNDFPTVGGNPLNPAGSSRRGYIRIQQGRIGIGGGGGSLPQRPTNQANSDEQRAANAARNGQTDQAINNLNNAINSGNSDPNDLGFRLQQRATLFLERRDYVRAADDFQAAITAYQDQVDSGKNVTSARAGLRSSRSGLNAALAGQRGG